MSAPSGYNDEVRRLLHEHVPEVASGIVEIKSIAREQGQRTIVALHSTDSSVCPVGSAVGRRGLRVKTMMRQLPGETIDIVKWSESIEEFIRNALAPAKVDRIVLDAAAHRATVHASGESLSLLQDRQGLKQRLAGKLVGWDIQILET